MAWDTLPPNLQQLFVNDCHSATPLLPLAQLKVLRIGEHCHMPAEELQRLSTLTQLESLKPLYNVWSQAGGGQRAAEHESDGWLAVSGVLQDLQLRAMEVDPDCELLAHLGRLTALTCLVWVGSRITPDLYNMHREGTTDLSDGGLSALSYALPKSLHVLEFRRFLLDVGGHTSEKEIILGLNDLVEAAAQLPNLEDDPSGPGHWRGPDHWFCRGGEELVGMLLARGNAICAPGGAGADSGEQAAGGIDGFWELLMDTFPDGYWVRQLFEC